MKKIYFLFLQFLFLSTLTFSQNGNEWINYNQKYFYFPVHTEGIYRISYNALINNGIDANTISNLNVQNFQIFARGQEVPIYISDGNTNNIFNPGDFIEFYAYGNDGSFDVDMYDEPQSQSNPNYSLINDTIYYYFTWNNFANNARIQESNQSDFSANPTISQFCMVDLLYSNNTPGYVNTLYFGRTYSGGTVDLEYSKCSGFFDSPIFSGGSKNVIFNTSNIYQAGPLASLTGVLTTQGDYIYQTGNDHTLSLTLNNSSTPFYTQAGNGYQQYQLNNIIQASSLQTSNTIQFTSNAIPNISLRATIAYLKLTYPATFNFQNQSKYKFSVNNAAGQANGNIQVSNFNSNNTPILYDLTNGRRIRVFHTTGSNNFSALIPNAAGEKTCYVSAENEIININALNSVGNNQQFTNFNNLNAEFIIVSANSLMDKAMEYRNFRSARFSSAAVNVHELYHQFGNGIKNHPLAIRRFLKFALNTWQVKPIHVFLFGKSLHNHICRYSPANFQKNLVPSLGTTSADQLLVAKLGILPNAAPSLSVGRLAASNVQLAELYYNKITEYESKVQENGYTEWMKNFLHFGGGTSLDEQNELASYLANYKSEIEGPLLGGKVQTFLKSTSAPIDNSLANQIRENVDSGVVMMTFFGHAAGSSFDINIDPPVNYNNKGKYPFIMALSCLAGDIHLLTETSQSTSEEFLLIQNKGAIAFLANVGPGLAIYLNRFGEEFHSELTYENYGATIGEFSQRAFEKVFAAAGNDYSLIKANIIGMTLHGDPAIQPYQSAKPDYTVRQKDISLNPANPTLEIDSFDVNIVVTNLGRADGTQFVLNAQNIRPSGTIFNQQIVLSDNVFKRNVTLRFPINKAESAGLNRFIISVDYNSDVDEWREDNNVTEIQYFIQSNSINPAYPPKFAIVPNQGVTLKATTGNLLDVNRRYIFEVDTTDNFNSPIKQNYFIESAGGLITWKPALLENMADSAVYFWRVGQDSVDANGYLWRESSFRYISGKSGWNQSHFQQLKVNNFNFLDYNRTTRSINFKNVQRELSCLNIGNPADLVRVTRVQYKLDTELGESAACGFTPSIHVAVIDPNTLEPWAKRWYNPATNQMENPNRNFGNANDSTNCRTRMERYFIFRANNTNQLNNLMNMLQNHVPDSFHILVYSVWRPLTQTWPVSVHNGFTNLGASGLTSAGDQKPFIFYVQKGNPNTAITLIGSTDTSEIELKVNLIASNPFGEIKSPKIGPSKNWNALHFKTRSIDSNAGDSVSLSIYGVDFSGNEFEAFSYKGLIVDDIDLNNKPQLKNYPYLKLKTNFKDNVNQTAPAFKEWFITYDPIPELTINPKLGWELSKTELAQGEKLYTKAAIQNISNTPIDSFYVRSWIQNQGQININPNVIKAPGLKPDSFYIAQFELSTLNNSGNTSLWVEANPQNQNWQLESEHFNNLAFATLKINRDLTHPLLDVTFDGLHIMDGEIVSPTPHILIKLKDENQFLALNDTSKFAIYLTKPGESPKPIHFASNEIIFHPAVLPNNSCLIEFSPRLMTDGKYYLSVETSDISNNKAGRSNYEISFEVVTKATITEIMNYPNPFTTSTRFVFTLTGTELPDQFYIQILTITGKIVKEIYMDDLGPLRIGRNITQYAWDGTDNFGDRLANGVYLYRVVTKIRGQEIEKRQNEASKFFHKGFGKMYLFR